MNDPNTEGLVLGEEVLVCQPDGFLRATVRWSCWLAVQALRHVRSGSANEITDIAEVRSCTGRVVDVLRLRIALGYNHVYIGDKEYIRTLGP